MTRMQKINNKLKQIFDRLSGLSFKQVFIICVPMGIAFFAFQTYKDFFDTQNSEILSKEEIEYLYKWYESDYERDLEEALQNFSLPIKEARKLNNPDPTIPFIYKIPKYIMQNPDDEWTTYIFSSYLGIHTRYFVYQFDIDEQAKYAKIKPEELMLFDDLFQAYKALMQIDSIQALNLASAFIKVGVYMSFADSNNDYCEVWGDMRNKIEIALKDIDTMLKTPLYQEFLGEDGLKRVKKGFTITSKGVKKLRTC